MSKQEKETTEVKEVQVLDVKGTYKELAEKSKESKLSGNGANYISITKKYKINI